MTASTTGFERTTETDMVNDDERRRVAARLREFTKDNQWPLTVGGNSSTIRHAISDIVFGDKKYHSGVDLLDRLADLIEPPARPSRVVRAYAEEVDWHTGESPLVHELRGIADRMDRECAPVDRDALLGLADNLDSSASMLLKQNDLDPNRKRRGMRRDHAQSLMVASGRIREALGVES